jgi:HEAT repeat protein/lysophospholipase L1-like esterase
VTVRARRLVQNLLLSAASVVVFLALAEGVARLFDRKAAPRPTAAYITDWANWDGDFYTVKSTAVGWPPWEDYNHDGLRDREHAAAKPAGVRRVICLGDSTTLGWGIQPAEAYPQVLQDRLDALGRRVEVFNVALGGWSTRQELIAYRKIARRYAPDLVLLGVCLNDIPEMRNNLSRPSPFLAALHRRSALVRRLVAAEDREIKDVLELFTAPDAPKVRAAYEDVFADVRALRDDARADGAELAILVFPFRLQVRADAQPPLPQQRIAAFCAAERIRCLDLLPALRAAGEDAYIDYDHFSPQGARLVADQVAESALLAEEEGASARGPTTAGAPAFPAGPATGSAHARSVPELTQALASGSTRDRAAAARALATMGAAAAPAARPLAAALDDADERVRAAAAWALGTVAEDAHAAVPALARVLDDPHAEVRAGAAWSLGRLGEASRSAVPALVARLDDTDASVRWRTGDALGRIGPDASALPALLRVLDRAESPGRAEAAAALGKMGPAASPAVPSLVRALADPREEVRWRAAWALGEIGPAAAEAVPALIAAMRDAEIRWRVADALGGIGPAAAAAVPALTAALVDESSTVRWRAAKALGRIGPPARSATAALVGASRDPQENVRLAAVRALGRITPDPGLTVPALVAALDDADSRARGEAALSLGRLGRDARPAIPALARRLADEDRAVRGQAARALGKLGPLPDDVKKALEHATARDAGAAGAADRERTPDREGPDG